MEKTNTKGNFNFLSFFYLRVFKNMGTDILVMHAEYKVDECYNYDIK